MAYLRMCKAESMEEGRCANNTKGGNKYCTHHENEKLLEKIQIAMDALQEIATQQYGRPTAMMNTAREALRNIQGK